MADSRTVSPLATIVALAAAPAVALGIARFAYALLLPDMRADLGWSWADAGWMNTNNALGYLFGALFAARAIDSQGSGRTMLGGAIACVVSLALCAVLRDTMLLNLARLLAGLGGGFAFVAGGVLATGVAARDPERSSFLLGLFYAGPGFGIAVSGLLVPIVLATNGPGSWPLAWALLAGIAALLSGVLPFAMRADAGRPMRPPVRSALGGMAPLMAGYALFGAGYIAYMTFMVAWVRDGDGGAAAQGLFWATIGGGAMVSPWLWARVLAGWHHGRAFALLCAITALGGVLPLVPLGTPSLLLSGALFGCAFFSVVASTTAFVRRNFPVPSWGRAIGALTVSFGLGQILGPVLIGSLNDWTDGLSSGLVASALLLMLGAGIALTQRDFPP